MLVPDRRQFGYLIFRQFASSLCACYANPKGLHFWQAGHWKIPDPYLLLKELRLGVSQRRLTLTNVGLGVAEGRLLIGLTGQKTQQLIGCLLKRGKLSSVMLSARKSPSAKTGPPRSSGTQTKRFKRRSNMNSSIKALELLGLRE